MDTFEVDLTPPVWEPDFREQIQVIISRDMPGYLIVDPPVPDGGWGMLVTDQERADLLDDEVLGFAAVVFGYDLGQLAEVIPGAVRAEGPANLLLVNVVHPDDETATPLTAIVSLDRPYDPRATPVDSQVTGQVVGLS